MLIAQQCKLCKAFIGKQIVKKNTPSHFCARLQKTDLIEMVQKDDQALLERGHIYFSE